MAFGSVQFRENDVRANNISGKWRSSERRFVKMTFGYTAIPENNVRLNNDSEKYHSALWSSGNSTIRLADDSVKLRSVIFFFLRDNNLVKWRFGKIAIRWNDVSGKWCGPEKSRICEKLTVKKTIFQFVEQPLNIFLQVEPFERLIFWNLIS